MSEFRESSVVLYEDKIIDFNLGNAGAVEFNFERIWKFKKSCKSFSTHLLEFVHTHPVNFAQYSSTDLNCMKGFYSAFGSNIFFTIIIFYPSELNDLGYEKISYIYDGKEAHISPCQDYITEEAVSLLKILSHYTKEVL